MNCHLRSGSHRLTMVMMIIALMIGSVVVTSIQSEDADALVAEPTYTVILEGNGGTSDGNSREVFTVASGVKIGLPYEMFSRDGYMLEYWSDGTQNYRPGDQYTITKDTTFTAQWRQGNGNHLADETLVVGEHYELDFTDKSGVSGNRCEKDLPSWLVEDGYYWDFAEGTPTEPGTYYVGFEMSYLGISPTSYWFCINVVSSSSNDFTLDDYYTVEFDLNGGVADDSSELVDISRPAGTVITLPSPDSCHKSGNTLLGWSVMVNGIPMTATSVCGQYTIDPVDAGVSEGESILMEAQWYAETYGIIFNAFGYPGVSQAVAKAGETYKLTATNETMEGHTFGGWTLWDDTDTVIPIDTEYVITGGTHFFGYWIPDGASTYHIEFDANGGSGDLEVDVEHGKSVFLPTAGVERNGYIFDGWYTSANGGTEYTGDSFTPEGNTKLYAHWVQSIIPVTDITITGTSVVSVGSTIVVQATATPSEAEERGVYFSITNGTGGARIVSQEDTTTGGYAEIIGTSAGTVTLIAQAMDGSGVTETKTLTVLAAEETHTFTLVYDANGGSWTGDAPNETVNGGTSASHTFTITTVVPVQDGYTFLGWAAEGSNVPQYGYQSNQLTELTVYEDVTTLHAIWEENINTFSLTYNANGGLWPDTYEPTYTDSRGSDGSSYEFTVRSEQPVYLGYLFLGWSSEEIAPGEGTEEDVEYVAGSKIDVSDSEIIYAVWGDNRCTYILKFDANGGTWPNGQPSPMEELTAATYWTFTIPSGEDYIPTLTGRTFVGWSVNGSGIISEDDVVYSPGDIVVFHGTSGQTSEVILMAVWGDGKDSHTLTFDGNGEEGDVIEGVPDPKVEPTDSEGWSHFTLPSEEPTRVGADGTVYIFNGWDTDENALNGGYDPSQAVSSANDFTLYAIWSVGGRMVSVTFFPNVSDTSVTEMPDNLMGQILDGKDSVDIQIPEAEPKREGYNFIGWANGPGSDNIYCSPGQLIPVSEDLDLFAIWRAVGESTDTFDVVFDSNGGTPVTSQSIASGGHAERPEDPTREGFTFDGWMLDGQEFDFENTPIISDITLVAAWTDGSGGGQDSGDDDDDTGGGNDAVIWILVAICLILFIVILVRR